MTERIINTPAELSQWITFLQGKKLPITVSSIDGRDRTSSQNRLQRMWCNEIAEQMGDRTPEEVRGFCKLTMGVPILRAEDPEFCEAYDRIVKPLPYEDKVACMMEPIDFPVTRRMKVRQKVRFLDDMYAFWTSKGLRLTEPDADLAVYQSRMRQQKQEAA